MEKDGVIISVIMPTYNRANRLKDTVESVLAQSFDRFELIIINDGSDDNTGEICTQYAEKEQKIKFINYKKNKGASYARNIGIKESEGEFITFVDDDDIVDKKMLDFLYNLAIQYKADISICGCWYGYEERICPKYIFEELVILDKVEGLNELLKREKYNSSNPNKLFRKELFLNVNYIEGKLVDDIHVIYRLFAQANKVVAKGKPLYTYMRHGKNNSTPLEKNTWTPELLREYMEMQKERVKYLTRYVPEITNRVRYSEWSYYISMCHKIRVTDNRKCDDQYSEMINILRKNKSEFLDCLYTTENEKRMIKMYVE
ncbi:MAG: glycosyltransferase [Vallitalea sp.]|jgi:glycosyltransferase involved in cell wall biosynthesis|nr:glycosyltransferase [Vallitalea sp.]